MSSAHAPSGRPNRALVLWLIVLGTLLGALVPPFQSPDEFDHVKRAYLLGKGVLVLETPAGGSSGGQVDTGLLAYMDHWRPMPFKPAIKESADERRLADAVAWSGTREFSTAPGTGYYFPVMYAPQAIGLAAGELMGLTVADSYRLARSMALASVGVLLALAFAIFPVNPLALALLALPMTAFQVVSASLDGVSTALAVLALSLFLRIAADAERARAATVYGLIGASFLLASSRVHLLPLLALAFLAVRQAGGRRYRGVLVVATLAVIGWILVAMRSTVDTRVPLGASPASIALHYTRDPIGFLRLVGATLAHEGRLVAYRDEFIGVLGWLDARFGRVTYRNAALLLAGIALLSISRGRLPAMRPARALLAACALACTLLVFFALLVAWNPPPATVIDGVQGRYFLIPALMLAYAIAGDAAPAHGIRRKAALVLLAGLVAITAARLPELLLERYFVRPAQEVLVTPGRPWIASPVTATRVATPDLVPADAGAGWRATGPHPAFVFAPATPIDSRTTRVMVLRFECDGPRQPVALRLSWRGPEGTFGDDASLRFALRPGFSAVELSPHAPWMRSGPIAALRIELEAHDACRVVTVDDVALGRFEWH